MLIGPEICWEPNNSGYYPRNFKTNPPILRNSMKIIDISILENPIFCKWRLFPDNNIMTNQKHWKNHCRFSGNDFFNVLKVTPFTSNRNIDLSQFWRSKKHNLSSIYRYFRLNFMRKHVLSHADSCRVTVDSKYIRLSHAEVEYSFQLEKSGYHNFALFCKRDFEQHDTVPII